MKSKRNYASDYGIGKTLDGKLSNGKPVRHYWNSNDFVIYEEIFDRWDRGEGYIPTEAEIAIMNDQFLLNRGTDGPFIYAVNSDLDTLKIVQPYDLDSKKMTPCQKILMKQMHYKFTDDFGEEESGINPVDCFYDLKGDEVSTIKKKDLKKFDELELQLYEKDFIKYPIAMIEWGHPDYVPKKFARNVEDIEKGVSNLFRHVKEKQGLDYVTMHRGKGTLSNFYNNDLRISTNRGKTAFGHRIYYGEYNRNRKNTSVYFLLNGRKYIKNPKEELKEFSL